MGTIRVAVLGVVVGLLGACSTRGPMRIEVRDGAGLPEQFESVWRGLQWGFSPADAAKLIDTQTPFQAESLASGVVLRSILDERIYDRDVEARLFFPDGGLRSIDLEPQITTDRYQSLATTPCQSAWNDYYGGLTTKPGKPWCEFEDLSRVCSWSPDPDLEIRLTFKLQPTAVGDGPLCRIVIEYRDVPWLERSRANSHQAESKKL